MKMPSVPGFSVMSILNKLMKPMEGMSGGSMQGQLENQAQANARRARAEERREARTQKQQLRDMKRREIEAKRALREERRNQARNVQAEKQRQREASRQARIEKEQKIVAKREDRQKVSRIRKELGDAGYKKAKWSKNVEWLNKIEDEKRRAEKEAELMESVREQGHFVFQTTRMGNGWIEIKDTESIKGELMQEVDEYDRPTWSEDEVNDLFK